MDSVTPKIHMPKTTSIHIGSALILFVMLGACSSDSEQIDSETQMVFDLANGRLHTIHIESLQNLPWRTGLSEWACDSGSIEMDTVADGTNIILGNGEDLDHDFDGCILSDIQIDGNVDYKDLQTCEGGGLTFAIVGTINTSITGNCDLEARELCDGSFTGLVCGKEL